MHILFTGGTSFTGMHFVEALKVAGHNVLCTCSKSINDYSGIYQQRLQRIQQSADVLYSTRFGDERWVSLIKKHHFDIVCLHGAYTKDYQEENFDISLAYESNLNNIEDVFKAMSTSKPKVIITGSIFAGHDNSNPSLPFSLYGLSKKITSETFEAFGLTYGIDISTFVIPNPFGALDNHKLVHIFGKAWLRKEIPTLVIADYIRDNIHVELLALGYVFWLPKVANQLNTTKYFKPSGYCSTMHEFITLFAKEMKQRWNIPCDFESLHQPTHSQPTTLINSENLMKIIPEWKPNIAWDRLADDIRARSRES